MIVRRFQQRSLCEPVERFALSRGLTPLQSRIVASRCLDVDAAAGALATSLKDLDHPGGLPDVDKAAERIFKAIRDREHITLCCDHDADGTGAAAVLRTALIGLGAEPERLHFHISHRLTEGYGLNELLARRILAAEPRPSLVITADCGSSDEPRIADLRRERIDCIVTDHHGIPAEGVPRSAYAVVSPLRADSLYPDRAVCGAMVAWLLMCRVRSLAAERGSVLASHLNMGEMLAIVAISTVADCVSMASKNNRIVVRHGLKRLNQSDIPFCVALREMLCAQGGRIDEETIGFQIAPRLAAHGRLDESMPGIRFLLATDLAEARTLLSCLTEANEVRKDIQKGLNERAMTIATAMVAEGVVGLAVYLEEGMAGVHGITSSRITEYFGLPSAMISQSVADASICSVSARSARGANMRQVLQDIADRHPGMLLSHGGHAGAGGARLKTVAVPAFQAAFNAAVVGQIGLRAPERTLWNDGISGAALDMRLVEEIAAIGPYGRGFEYPSFLEPAEYHSAKRIGRDGNTLSLMLRQGSRNIRAVWFRALEEDVDFVALARGGQGSVSCRVREDFWQGERRLNVLVDGIV